MDHKDLLLEVGTEEIPAAFLPDVLAALKDKAEKALQSQRIAFNEISTVGTPRRLALLATGVAVSPGRAGRHQNRSGKIHCL